jgi:hypothetical protein
VAPVVGVAPVLEQANDQSNRTGSVDGLIAYSTPESRMSHALITLDGAMWAIRDIAASADARDNVARVVGPTCVGAVPVTPDARQLACLIDTTAGVNPPICYGLCAGQALQIDALTSGGAAGWPPRVARQQVLGPESTGDEYLSPTWLSDGLHLAVSRRPPAEYEIGSGDDCRIEFYATTAVGSPLVPSARFESSDGSSCDVVALAWSPDGGTLAVLLPTALDLVPRAAFAPSAFVVPAAATPPPLFVFPLPRTIVRFSQYAEARAMAWAPDGRSVAVLTNGELQRVAIPADTATPLILPSAGTRGWIGPFAWAPDGRTLLFAFGERMQYLFTCGYTPCALSHPSNVVAGPTVSSAGAVGSALASSVERRDHAQLPQQCFICPLPPDGIYRWTPPD